MHKGLPLVPPCTWLEGGHADCRPEPPLGISEDRKGNMEALGEFELVVEARAGKAGDPRAESGQFGGVVAEAARLWRAAPGARDGVPARGHGPVGTPGAGVVEHGTVAAQLRQIDRALRRVERERTGRPVRWSQAPSSTGAGRSGGSP